jgi:hypothetical protein
MCNLYSVTTSQTAILEWTRAMRDITGNLPPMPGVFPDYLAPIVRNAPDGARELMLARWVMPLHRALSPTFPAGAMVFFIPSRGGAEDVAEGSGAAHLDRQTAPHPPPGWCSGC